MPRRKREASSAVLEVPPCPRGHEGSKVVFGGFYGKPGKRRQMYRCSPVDGDPPHRFVPPLPRVEAPESSCLECENPVHAHEGPRLGRQFSYPVRTIAEVLGRVAHGEAYQRAARDVRNAPSDSGQLVADWVEAFSADLWDALGPTQWPAYLVSDSRRFFVRKTFYGPYKRGAGRTDKGVSEAAYRVVSLVGSNGPTGRLGKWFWKPVLTVATPTLDDQDWLRILGLLPGRPLTITTDEDNSLMNAVQARWPLDPTTGEVPPRINYCLYHLAEGFRNKAVPGWTKRPHGDISQRRADALWYAYDHMTEGPDQWMAFVGAARGLKDDNVNRWLRRRNRVNHVRNQLAHPLPGEAHSNAAAEAELRWVGGQWAGRHGSYRNAGRTNRLLALMTLARRGSYDRTQWADVIGSALEARGGRPAQQLRSICDPYSRGARPSLRAP